MERVLARRTSPAERGADALAARALAGRGLGRRPVPRSAQTDRAPGRDQVPARFGTLLADAGEPLRPGLSTEMGHRFGYDFSRVRLHAGTRAEQTCRRLGVEAFTVGDHVVLGPGGRDPRTGQARRLLAHELAHVTQPGPPGLRPYRNPKAFNFGVADDAHLTEDSFDPAKDKASKPWLSLVKVDFSSQDTDTNGDTYWKGTGTATYHNNPVKPADFTFSIAGGSRTLGMSDAGSFTVHRIEGVGYNSGSYSGRAGVDFQLSEREGPRNRYTKPDAGGFRPSNMSFAVFYNGGEALHEGPLDVSSHGCVHVDWGAGGTMRQLNYHSVIGLTRVKVSYPKKP